MTTPEQRLVLEQSHGGYCVPYEEDAFAGAIIELLNPRNGHDRWAARSQLRSAVSHLSADRQIWWSRDCCASWHRWIDITLSGGRPDQQAQHPRFPPCNKPPNNSRSELDMAALRTKTRHAAPQMTAPTISCTIAGAGKISLIPGTTPRPSPHRRPLDQRGLPIQPPGSLAHMPPDPQIAQQMQVPVAVAAPTDPSGESVRTWRLSGRDQNSWLFSISDARSAYSAVIVIGVEMTLLVSAKPTITGSSGEYSTNFP